MKLIRRILMASFTFVSICAYAYKDVQYTDEPQATPGVWNTNFELSLDYAKKSCTPVLMYYGVYGCGYAEKGVEVLNQKVIRDWFSSKRIVMVYKRGSTGLALKVAQSRTGESSPDPDCWKGDRWVTEGSSVRGYPIMRMYWLQTNGVELSQTFSLRNRQMPVKEPSGGSVENLTLQMLSTLEKYFGNYNGTSNSVYAVETNDVDSAIGSFGVDKTTYTSAMVDENGNLRGIVTAVASKASKIRVSKVSMTFSDIVGKCKTVSFQVSVDERSFNRNVSGLGELDARIDNDELSGTIGEYTIEPVGDIGGIINDDNMIFELNPSEDIGETFVVMGALPVSEPISFSGKKVYAMKFGGVMLDKRNGEITVSDSNPSALKLTYTPSTGLFKGSFKVYTYDSRIAKDGSISITKLNSISANVRGFVVDGVGYGVANIRGIGMFDVRISNVDD